MLVGSEEEVLKYFLLNATYNAFLPQNDPI